jgi:hypothetical protein
MMFCCILSIEVMLEIGFDAKIDDVNRELDMGACHRA